MKNKGLSIRKKSKGVNTNDHIFSVPELIDKIIAQADIILEILDARFIEKTRNKEIEKKIIAKGKKLIFVLNKSDLINMNEASKNIEFEDMEIHVFVSSTIRTGKDDLKYLIRREAAKINKDAVNIGIMGYPNTGKSSIINLLAGRKAAKTSSQSGFTKGLQKIRFADGLYLIDTPGLIPMGEKMSHSSKDLIKHSEIGVRTWDRAGDPELAVHCIMQEYPGKIEGYYNIDAKGDSDFLIEELGKRLHCFKKGGVVDSDRVSRQVLRNWQEGKIKVDLKKD
jgi:ribosome biogenesis GTPase A